MSFPPSPSSQGTPSMDSPLGQLQQLTPDPRPGTSSGAFVAGGSITPPTVPGVVNPPTAGGAVRRKPARRANTAERRATHNAVERQRRETLNGRFLDLAAVLPNLATVRRPSKSAIVNSSIALIRTQHRLRAIAARELRQLAAEANALRREVNQWRSAHPASPAPSAKMDSSASLDPVAEPVRSADFMALMELEDVPEDSMNEQERMAYEMRGGDSGPLAAATFAGEDGDDDFGIGGEDDFSERFVMGHPSTQGQQQQQQFSTTPGMPSIVPANAGARAQSLNVHSHLQQQQQIQHQFTSQHQQHQPSPIVAQFQPQLQIDAQQAQSASAAAAASLIPSPYPQASLQQQQQQYATVRHQHHQPQPQAMQVAQTGFSDSDYLPPSFDAIAAAAAGGYSNNTVVTHQQPLATNEQDAAKLAAWNAHLFSTALVAQQQQQQQFGIQFHTPPPSSHGPTARFGSNHQATSQQQQPNPNPNPNQLQHFQRAEDAHNYTTTDDSVDATSVSTPSSHASSATPSLSLSLSGLSGASTGSGAPSSAGGSAYSGSIPPSLASPLHDLSLSGAQQDAFGGFAYSSAPSAGANWGNVSFRKSLAGTPVVSTPPIAVGGGGGGQFPMMSMFM